MSGLQGGCSKEMEEFLRKTFFSILTKLALKLGQTENVEEAFTILYSL